jgi:hypothetical protein
MGGLPEAPRRVLEATLLSRVSRCVYASSPILGVLTGSSTRQLMDAMELQGDEGHLGIPYDRVLSDIWDWCVVRGCRSVCTSGRLYMKKGKWDRFRWARLERRQT